MANHHPGLPAAGSSHPRVRQYLNAKRNRTSVHARTVALEGVWTIRHALDANAPVEVVFVCPPLVRSDAGLEIVARARNRGAAAFEVSERVLGRLVSRDGPDGLAALARLPPAELCDLPTTTSSRVVVVDGLQFAGNVGAIIRAADGAGADAVVVTNRRVRLTHPLIVKASMGTVFTTPLVNASREAAIGWLRENGFRIIAAHPDSERSYRGDHYRGPVALVVGSEGRGLSAQWLDSADLTVSIPMLGVADSLNVGHATALLLYEALHGRVR